MSISPTLVVPLLSRQQSPFKTRALLDSGSGTNWIVSSILKHVQHTVKGAEMMEVHTFNGAVRKKYPLVEIYYKDAQDKVQSILCYVHDSYIRHIQLNITDWIKTNYDCTPFQAPITLSDPSDKKVSHGYESQGVALVLCSATTNRLRTNHDMVHINQIDILLEPTIFGTAISGAIPEHLRSKANQVSVNCAVPSIINKVRDPCLFIEDDKAGLSDDISFLWNQENLGIQPEEPNIDHTTAWNLFLETISRNQETGQYTVGLPFNEKKHLISDNINVAAARTYRQQELMLENKTYGESMVNAKADLDNNDYVELVDTNAPTGDVVYYMPFRGIIKTESDTTKCRLVMDASSKPTASHVSLNQALYQGPNLIIELAFILLRFMLGFYATIADIEKAFLRIMIHLCDRDALRFFWFVNPWDPGSKLVSYRFKAVMFGSAASPFQLAAVLQVLIRDECTNREVQKALLTRIYVDDLTFSHDLQQKILQYYDVTTGTLRKGFFNPRQWASNSPKLMEKAKSQNVANESKLVKVLGMFWNIDMDTLEFNTNVLWDNLFTKRSALRFCNKIFDPLGLLSPILVRLRMFLQTLWEQGIGWDKTFELVEDLKQKWLHLVNEAQIATKGKMKRRAIWTENSEIHIFSDASKSAYGAVVYVRTPPCPKYPEGDVHLICAKSRVKPIKGNLTIPRLELAGALVAAHQVPYLTKAWDLPHNTKFHIWCDAKVVLHWLQQYNVKETYVNNRVTQIRNLCKDHWETIKLHYVPTDLNPADIITREQKADEFVNNEMWWKGPAWLLQEHNWPQTEENFSLYPEGKPIKTSVNTATLRKKCDTSILSHFSKGDFHSNMRVTAYTLRAFIKPEYNRITKTSASKFNKNHIHKDELAHAKLTALKVMQREAFANELETLQLGNSITKGPRKKWKPFLDNQGIIRCRHRLDNLPGNKEKYPILVHGKHPFVQGYVTCKHEHENCSSRQYTLHIIKKEIDGPGIVEAAKRAVRACNLCRILRAKPYAYPEHPPLPEERLTARRPFAVSGVDYSGPHNVKQGRATMKIWIALFTCMVSRAIHLEIVPDLSTKTFLEALQNTTWKKGAPKVLLSDNATCFVGANKALKEISNQNATITGLATKGIEWHFTPARAPWFGAVYERLIGILKKELTKLAGNSSLTYHELSHTLAQVEGVINRRPLIQVGTEEVLSPMNILTGRSDDYEDTLNVLDTKEILLSASQVKNDLPRMYQDTERRLAKFWQTFQHQYLERIKFSPDTSSNKGGGLTPQVGDLVIIHSHDPRLKWRKAIVLENMESADGQIRKCKLKTSTGQMIRALKHLYPLEINVETFIDKIKEKKWSEENDFEGFDDLPSSRDQRALELKSFVSRLDSHTLEN